MHVTDTFLSKEWLNEFSQYETLYVGLSGGLDSTVLLHALIKTGLSKKLIAVHIHHGLNDQADLWMNQCESFCKEYHVKFVCHYLHIEKKNSIEETARNLRRAYFSSLLTKKDALILAHHMNDQAETILFKLLRGAGVSGLGG